MSAVVTPPISERELVLTRLMSPPRAKLFRAWTEADLLKQWFAPRPLTTPVAELDVRAGGECRIVMRGPDGTEYPSNGIYLEIVRDERIVFTDAYGAGRIPTAKPFMTVIVTFADEGEGTRYTARALHWKAEDRAMHETMGFHEGWGRCADQLAEVVARL